MRHCRAGSVRDRSATSAFPFLAEQPFDRGDRLADAVEVRVDAESAAEAAEGSAELLLLHEALGQAAGGAEVAWIEPQSTVAVGGGASIFAATEMEDAALVMRLGEPRRLAKQGVEVAQNHLGADLVDPHEDDPLQLGIVLRRVGAEPDRPHRLAGEPA